MGRWAPAALAVALLLPACTATDGAAGGATPPPSPSSATSTPPTAAPAPPASTPAPSPAPSPTPAPFDVPSPPPPAPVTQACPPAPPSPTVVDPATLSLREQAGLVLVAGIPGVVDADAAEAAAVLAADVGGLVLKRENLTSPAQARELLEELHAAAPLGLLTFTDQEGGRVAHARDVVDDTPSARRLGDTLADDPTGAAVREAGATVGTGLRGAGVHGTLGPVADLDDGPFDAVIGDRSFGASAEVATPASVAFVEGLHARGTLAVAKHFPGYAGAADTHTTGAALPLGPAELADDLAVFEALVAAGVDAVMVGHVSYDAFGGVPASLDPLVYERLRATGFDGVAMTDSLGMGAVYGELGHAGAAVASLAAGADVLLVNQGSEAAAGMRAAIVEAVRSGDVPRARLDEAARRVMRLRVRQAEVAAGCGRP